MSTIPDTRGAPQFSELAVQTATPMIGGASREDGQTVISNVDSELSKLFEDRNVLLTGGGAIGLASTSLSFGETLYLHINSKVAGGSPVIISLGSTTRTFTNNNNMLYAVVDRSAGTATITADSSTLPSVVAANQEVFLLAKRSDTSGGTKKVYLRNGTAVSDGQSVQLGSNPVYTSSQFNVDSSGNLVKLNSVTYSWPGSQGSLNTFLKNDGSGNLSWSTPSAGAAGSSTYVQYNNANALAGSSNFVWDFTNNRLGIGTSAPSSDVHIINATGNYGPELLVENTNGAGNNILAFFKNGNGRGYTYFGEDLSTGKSAGFMWKSFAIGTSYLALKYIGATDTEGLLLSPSNYVGIGAGGIGLTDIVSPITAYSNTAATVPVTIRNADTTATTNILDVFGSRVGSNVIRFGYDTSNAYNYSTFTFDFVTAGSGNNTLVIGVGGNSSIGIRGSKVGIGTATPAFGGSALQVNGNVDVYTGNTYKINATDVLSATTLGSAVVNSSLTSVGTLTSLNVTGNVTVDTNVLYVDVTNNRVGINNTPGYALDVTGTANISTGNTYKIAGTDVLSSTALGSTIVGSSLTSVGTLTSLAVTGNLTVDTNVLYVDTTANLVGINKAPSTYALDIAGSANVTTGNNYYYNGSAVFPTSSTDHAIVRYDGTTGRKVQNSGITIDDSNNVASMGTLGCGAITSTGLLDVSLSTAHAANIELARLRWNTTSATAGDSGVLNFTNAAGTAIGRIANRHDGTNVGLSFWGFNNGAGALQEHVTILGTGKVGVGTNAPAMNFHVIATGNAFPATTGSTQTQGFRLGSSDVCLDMGIERAVGNCWIQSTQIDALGTCYNLLLNPNGGKVGIGTTAPSYPLEVIGNMTGTVVSGTNKIGTVCVPGVTYVTTAGQVFTFDCSSAKLFTISTGAGQGALVFADYVSTTITLVANPSSTFVASSTPSSGTIGIYKSANSHTVSIKTANNGVYLSVAVVGAVTGFTSPA